jgi:hypothetical protein
MALPKPDFAAIKNVYDAVKSKWSKLDEQDSEMLALWNMTYPVPHCEPEIENYEPKVIRSGWTRRAIKTFKTLFGKPVFRHEPGIGTAKHRLSEKIEDFLNTLPWAIEAAYGAFWDPAVEDVGKVGRGWVEVLPKRKRWLDDPDYPQQGKGNDHRTGEPVAANEGKDAYDARREHWKKDMLPAISIRHLPSHGVYAIITEGYHVLQAVRYVTISLAEAAQKWPKYFQEAYNAEDSDPTDEVACYEYMDTEWAAQAAEYKETGELIQPPYRHGMRMCPWVLIEGLTTASTDPNERWEPYLLEVKDVGIAMDAQLTRKAMITETYPMPLPVIEDPAAAPEGIEKGWETIELKPPQALVLYGGKTMHIENWGGWEPEAEYLWDKLEAARERSLPDVGAQIAEGSSGTPAWTWRLRGQMQERDMRCVADNLSLGAKRVGQAMLRAVQSRWINETVYVGKETEEGTQPRGLSPKEIEGQINRIEASIKSTKLIDRNQNLGAMKMAIDMGLGKRWALQEIGEYENPEEILEEALLEEVEFSDPMKQELLADIMERADIIEARESVVPPEQVASLLPFMPPGVQAAVGNVQGGGGLPPMGGLGTTGVPQGASATALTRTGVPATGGASPFAPGPGEPTGV